MGLAPRVGGVAIVDPLHRDDQPALEGGRSDDAQLEGVAGDTSVRVTRKNTTAGREDRVRRVGQCFDYEFTANAVRTANATNDVVLAQSA